MTTKAGTAAMANAAPGPTRYWVMLLAGLPLALAACAGAGDPPQAGLLDDGADLSSTTVDGRLEERERALAEAVASQSALRSALERSEAERAALEAEEAQLAARLDAVDRENRETQRLVAALRQCREGNQQRLDRSDPCAELVESARAHLARSRCEEGNSLCRTSFD